MQATLERSVASPVATAAINSRYARCIEVSKRIRWDIERDVIRGRRLDFTRKFMPDSLSKIGQLPFLAQGAEAYEELAKEFIINEKYRTRDVI
jgi:hypothetical protein